MSGIKASLFNIYGRQYMEGNRSPRMSRSCYRRAIFNGYADYLSILTIVSFGLISGSHRVRLMAHRCLKQILTDLLWKRRPPWKPPWNQIIRTLLFVLSTNVEKDLEIMNLSWVICNSIPTKPMPSLGVGVGDVCLVCYVTGDDGMPMSVYLVRIGTRGLYRSIHEECVDRHMSEAMANNTIDVLFCSALVLMDEAIRRRIKRPNHQHVWVYATITKLLISVFRRVPNSRVLRCNGWIAGFDFRKRKRWCIDKKKMFPKLKSHTRLRDTTKATNHIIRIAALELFCFFVTKLFDCVYTLMFNIVIFGSH